MAVKPTPTISKPQATVDMVKIEEKQLAAITRRDITLLPRWYPVAEAMSACAVLDALFLANAWYAMNKNVEPKWREMTRPRNKGLYNK